jgi:lysyl endopeptidase
MRKVALFAIAALMPIPLLGQVVQPFVAPATAIEATRTLQAPLNAAANPLLRPIVQMSPASVGAVDELARVRAWNAAGKEPTRIGIFRNLAEPVELTLHNAVTASAGNRAMVATSDELQRMAFRFEVEGASRLRLLLSEISLPDNARLWVTSPSGESVGFGLDLLSPEGTIWTPSVTGDAVVLEIEVPAPSATSARAVIGTIGHILSSEEAGIDRIAAPENLSCLTDGKCVPTSELAVIDLYRKAVAALFFAKDGSFGFCSGALLNDTQDSGTPYLLTANHCFDQQASAASLEAFWDYTTNVCEGFIPGLETLPRSTGATLLASSPHSDFTLVRLSTVPAGRVFLGWSAQTSSVVPGTVLHRLSHPALPDASGQFPQVYSQTVVTNNFLVCTGDSSLSLIRSNKVIGDIRGGSSGAPVIVAGGIVVGQLLGVCPGLDGEATCTNANVIVDGAFSATFPHVEQFLAPAGGGGEPCNESSTTLCLAGGRFEVKVSWRSQQGGSGEGKAVPVESDDSGIFTFFDQNNWELMIKVLNACPFANRIWVFYAATTNQQFTLNVRDTERGATKSYFNPLGQVAQTRLDTDAFATCP